MKKTVVLCISLLLGIITSWAQVPQHFSYQAVIRNNDGSATANQKVSVRISILNGSESGTVLYSETHSVKSNSNGLITLQIGDGFPVSGTFSNIDWQNGPFYLKTEVDPKGGSELSLVTTQQLLSVPFALYAEKAGSVKDAVDKGYVDNRDGKLKAYTDSLVKSMTNGVSKQYVDNQDNNLKKYVDSLLASAIQEVKDSIKNSTNGTDEDVSYLNNKNANDGVLPGVFSISSTKKVKFSQGNLQYSICGSHIVATGEKKIGTWRFSCNQYDTIGYCNKYASLGYMGWIDFFGWGTSGYHDTTDMYNVFFEPYSNGFQSPYSSLKYNCSGYGPSKGMKDTSLVGSSANYDWGVYNAIINGGNKPGMWRVLSKDEWDYLLNSRNGASGKIGMATISGIEGMVLLPDSWTLPTGCSFVSGLKGYSTNKYTLEQWVLMEKAGAVFLPISGQRYYNSGKDGKYASSTFSSREDDYEECFQVFFMSKGLYVSSDNTSGGFSVRLVQDVKQ